MLGTASATLVATSTATAACHGQARQAPSAEPRDRRVASMTQEPIDSDSTRARILPPRSDASPAIRYPASSSARPATREIRATSIAVTRRSQSDHRCIASTSAAVAPQMTSAGTDQRLRGAAVRGSRAPRAARAARARPGRALAPPRSPRAPACATPRTDGAAAARAPARPAVPGARCSASGRRASCARRSIAAPPVPGRVGQHAPALAADQHGRCHQQRRQPPRPPAASCQRRDDRVERHRPQHEPEEQPH